MLPIDLLTAYVICGASSCAGALMTLLARTGDAELAVALRTAACGFAVLGLSLLQLVLGASHPTDGPTLVSLFGTTVGLGVIGVGLSRLAGARAPGRVMAPLIGLALLGQVAAWAVDPVLLSVAYAGGVTTLCTYTTWGVRAFLLRPRHLAEALIGWAMVGFVLSYALRTALAIGHDGPASVPHAYGPDAVLRMLGILYGVMPVVMATLLLTVVNTRLSMQLARQALTDELTGALNRRALGEQAPALLAQVQAQGEGLAVMLLDIDHFKHINDTHGHAAGDEVLRQVVARLRAQLRPDALLTRYGGEEFALLVPVSGPAAAHVVAERLRSVVAAEPVHALPVTTSVGWALRAGDEPLQATLRRADAALYRAKQAGRNRVEAAPPWAEPMQPPAGTA